MTMGRWTDIATWRGPTVNQGGRMVEHRGVVVHIAEGGFEGTIAWQKNSAADVSSHFVVAADGRIAQMVDTDVTAWTQREGNGHWLSIENEGHTPNQLTAAQVTANAKILAKAHQVYGVLLQIATNPDGRGLGHHSMGGTGCTRWNWGHCDCPGPAIIAQKPAILGQAKAIINPPKEGLLMALSDAEQEVVLAAAKRLTEVPTWAPDGFDRLRMLDTLYWTLVLGNNGAETTWAAAQFRAVLDGLKAVPGIDPARVDAIEAELVAAVKQANGQAVADALRAGADAAEGTSPA